MIKPNKSTAETRTKASRSTKEQFTKDLAMGNVFEKKVAEIALKKYAHLGNKLVFSEGKTYWDFSIGGIKFEVKCDVRAAASGNIAFEWDSGGKPSGIARQEPDIWIHGIGEQGCEGILFANIDTIRENVLNSYCKDEGKVKYMKFLGDGASGFLMKIEDVKEFMLDFEKEILND